MLDKLSRAPVAVASDGVVHDRLLSSHVDRPTSSVAADASRHGRHARLTVTVLPTRLPGRRQLDPGSGWCASPELPRDVRHGSSSQAACVSNLVRGWGRRHREELPRSVEALLSGEGEAVGAVGREGEHDHVRRIQHLCPHGGQVRPARLESSRHPVPSVDDLVVVSHTDRLDLVDDLCEGIDVGLVERSLPRTRPQAGQLDVDGLGPGGGSVVVAHAGHGARQLEGGSRGQRGRS